MLTLRIGNIETDIVGDIHSSWFHSEFLAMRQQLRYRPEGYMFSPKFKKRQWDGWKNLAWKNSKRCYFPTGLFSIVRDHLNKRGLEYQIEDLRVKPEKTLNLTLNEEKYKIRDYQQRIIDSAIKSSRGIIQAATGSGKTIAAAGIIKEAGVKPFLFLVTSIDLLEQTKERLEDALYQNGLNLKVGRIGGGTVDIQDVNVMTVQTAVRVLGKKFVKFDSDQQDDNTDLSLLKKYKNEILHVLHNSKGVICDECITGDSLVVTRNGPVRMEELANRIGQEVLSFDESGLTWKKVTNFYKKGKRETIKIGLSNGTSTCCTVDHLIKTKNGWLPAAALTQNDFVLCHINGDIDTPFSLLSTDYVKVDSVESNKKTEVFDISVEDTHCFFANGMLVHNCQHWRADICQIVTNALVNCYYKYGLSATPYRDQGDDLLIQSCFGKKVCEIQASELIEKGHLVQPNIYFIHTNPLPSKFKNWQNLYKERIVEDPTYNQLVAAIAREYIKSDRYVLVLVQQIEHGKMLEDMIDGALFVYGNSPKKERLSALKRLKNRYIKCIISSVIFDEGIDLKELDTLILAGGGKSPTRALQRIGRVLRPFPGKETSTVVDFYIHEKYLEDHAKAREKIYRTEPMFKIEHRFI